MKTPASLVALMLFTIPTLRAQLVADGATNTLSNVTNVIPGGVTVGTNGSFTLLVLANNSFLTNSGQSEIGRNITARSNAVRLISPTARWHMLNPLNVGVNGSFNHFAISNGASVRSSQGTVGNSSAFASNNTVIVNGAGSEWSVASSFIVGLAGSGSRLEVSDGGRVNSESGWIGEAASNNLALVTGNGSVWSNTTDLTIGSARSSNRLVVSNAGSVFVGGTVLLGNLAASSNNQLTVNGGTLRVTNASATGTLNVRRGTAKLDAGLVEVDRLLLTNSQSRFEFIGGTLSTRSTTINNGLSFSVGNNVGVGTFILAGNGTHAFALGLNIFADSALTGNGSISGNTLIAIGGILSPGAAIGTLSFSSPPLLMGRTLMEISRTGTGLTNDRVIVTGTITYGGSLTVTNIGPTDLVAGDRFPLFAAGAYAGSFSSLTLPSLGSGLTWTNKLLVDGSIEVLGLIVQTLPASGLVSNTATLNGVVNPGGQNATAWFEYGFTTNYGTVTAPQALGSGTSSTNFSATPASLFGGVTYHFRAVASNGFGVVFGGDQTLTLPAFYIINVGLPGFSGIGAWGDYDNDGRLDIALGGSVWRNAGNGFTNVASLPVGFVVAVAWGDYDNDGRLDILFTGSTNFSQGYFSQVWRNTGSGFTNINAELPGVSDSSVAWGDHNNDGRLDILLTGDTESALGISQVWQNAAFGFVNINAGLAGVLSPSVAWGDHNNDGRLDILLTGFRGAPPTISQVLRNTGNGFTNINAGLPGVANSSVAWGDYDNDGWLDILLTGSTNDLDDCVSQVWRNTGSGFTNINAGLTGVSFSSAAWGDYDNDGRLDILLTGATNGALGSEISQVWRNTGGGFTNINLGLPGTINSVWGDYDNDGRLDIVLTGHTNGHPANVFSQVWRNNTPVTNTPPSAPSGLNVTIAGDTATFTWDAASDTQTPVAGLSYNLRVGTTPGGGELVGPMAATAGFRRLPQLGNAQMVNFRSVTVPAGQPLYWSVQAVDTAFAGGPFAPEQSFTINSVFTPTNGIPVPGDQNGDGIVSQIELAAVLANLNGNGILTEADLNLVLTNYFVTSPWLSLTNVAGLGGTNVTFALTNSLAGAFSVEYTTNLVDWFFLGPATPRYLFTDTNAPAIPQRNYRLRWP